MLTQRLIKMLTTDILCFALMDSRISSNTKLFILKEILERREKENGKREND